MKESLRFLVFTAEERKTRRLHEEYFTESAEGFHREAQRDFHGDTARAYGLFFWGEGEGNKIHGCQGDGRWRPMY